MTKPYAREFVETLKTIGIRYVFGIPSGNWVDYMEAIRETEGIEFILVSNEASGGFMADACWRLTGCMAACFGTFGPGACNLSTGVCCGLLDRSPMLAFTDEMSDSMLHRTTQMNIDHQALFSPLTKWTTRLVGECIEDTLKKAAAVARSEVPGPVHIGLPAGGLSLESTRTKESTSPSIKTIPEPDSALYKKMADIFARSERPVLAIGLSAVRAGVKDIVARIAQKHRVPVVMTPMTKGMLSEDHPSYAGVLAHALSDIVAETHQQADLIVGIGYDPVEINYEDWIPSVPLLNINTTPADLDQDSHELACDLIGDISASLERLLNLDTSQKKWDMAALAVRRTAMFEKLAPPEQGFDPRTVLADLRDALPSNGIMTCDVGAHLHLIGQQWRTPEPELQLMTNGCSSMGYGIPAAIGAKLAMPEREVCCVVGDGGFLMMAGEMATAKRLGKRIVFVIITDRTLSLIRIKQNRKDYETYGTPLHGRGYASGSGFFGVPLVSVDNRRAYQDALKHAFEAEGPTIIEAFVSSSDYDDLVLRGNK